MHNRPSKFEYEELLTCGRGQMYSADNPDQPMPQLPTPPMLMFDRISELGETGGEFDKGFIRAELAVKPELWFFACHFEGDPVMPGCLGLDALWQMTGFYLGWLGSRGKGRAISTGEVKFTGQITPETKHLEYGVDFRRVMRSRLILGTGDGWVKADGEIVFTAKDLRVGLFTEV